MKNLERGVVILAAGKGIRFQSNNPKQLLRVGGQTVIEHCLREIMRISRVREVVIVVSNDLVEITKTLIRNLDFETPVKTVIGGDTRQESSKIGCAALSKEVKFVAIHDVARPFVNPQIFEEGFNRLERGGVRAIDTVIPTADTIVEVDEGQDEIVQVLERRKLRRGQTPQFFLRELLSNLYDVVQSEDLRNFNDECGLVKEFFPKERIEFIKGNEANLKITTPFDAIIAEQILYVPTATDMGTPSQVLTPEDTMIYVYGGSSGIGSSLVKLLGVEKIRSRVFSRRTGHDICSDEAQESVINNIERDKESNKHLVVSIGVLEKRSLTQLDDDHLKKIFEVNLFSIARFLQKIVKRNIQIDSITLIGSSAYIGKRSDLFAYSASKAGLVCLLNSFVIENASFRGRINLIVPERTLTPMREANFADPTSDLLTSFEVAKAIIDCIASDLNGRSIHVRKRI